MKITQKISPEKREEIILLYLKDVQKKDIVKQTKTSWWHVINAIHNFEVAINGNSTMTENLNKIRHEEEKLIELAEKVARGGVTDFTEYEVRLNAYATADLMNYCVFIP